jgi:transposase
MNNASFHHSERIRKMCLVAGVEPLYLLPYSPNLNSIESPSQS